MNKPIKRKKGRFIIEQPRLSSQYEQLLPDEAWTVIYHDTSTRGWQYGFMADRRKLMKNYDSTAALLEDVGYSLECASEIVNNYYKPLDLRIIDTESGEIVNPLSEDELKGKAKPKIVQKDLFGNDFVWGVDI